MYQSSPSSPSTTLVTSSNDSDLLQEGNLGRIRGDPPTPFCGVWVPESDAAVAPGSAPLGRIHNLAQEEAAPREVVEDHDDEGPVEAEGERLGRCAQAEPGRGGGL